MRTAKRKPIKRLIVFLLAMLLICSVLPTSVFAENGSGNPEGPVTAASVEDYSFTIGGIPDAELSAGEGFNALTDVTLTVTDGQGQPVFDHNCYVDVAGVQRYIDGVEDPSYVWDGSSVLETSVSNVKYVVTYEVYDENDQPVGTSASRTVRVLGELTYEIVTGGDKPVVLDAAVNVLSGVYAKVCSDTTWDVTGEMGYSVAVSGIEKFNGTTLDAGYSWDGTTMELNTSVVGTAYSVTYKLLRNGSEVLVDQVPFTAVRTFTVISGTDIRPLLTTDDEYITYTRVETSTGTMPFDLNEDGSENNSPGNDGSADNLIVRSFDTYTYKVYVNSSNYTSDVAYENGYIHYRFVLPTTKEEAEFETASMSWMSTDEDMSGRSPTR